MRRLRNGRGAAGVAILMTGVMLLLGAVPGLGFAGVIPSCSSRDIHQRERDIEAVRRFLERKIVRERLSACGVSPGLAMEKIAGIDDEELHLLAAKIDRVPEGGDNPSYNDVFELMLIGAVAIIVFLGWIIYSIAKAVAAAPPPGDAPEPAREAD